MNENQVPGFPMSREAALRIALAMASINRVCPYCGQPMTTDDMESAIVADNADRDPCHVECWIKHIAEDGR